MNDEVFSCDVCGNWYEWGELVDDDDQSVVLCVYCFDEAVDASELDVVIDEMDELDGDP